VRFIPGKSCTSHGTTPVTLRVFHFVPVLGLTTQFVDLDYDADGRLSMAKCARIHSHFIIHSDIWNLFIQGA
jgi:hypothetical protein